MKDREDMDLENTDAYRDLTKPMGAQDPNRLKKFIEKYDQILDMVSYWSSIYFS